MAKMKKRYVSVQHPEVQKKIEATKSLSIKEGSYSSVMSGFGTSYLSPFVIALNATDSQIGWLNAITTLLPNIVQLYAARLLEKYSRKKIVFWFVLLQALMFIPIILTAWMFKFHVAGVIVVWSAIFFITLLYIFGAFAGPAWFSWMGSLVSEKERGSYFSRRNMITGFFGLVTMMLGGIVLDYSSRWGYVLFGFSALFLVSAVARMISAFYFTKHYEPHLKIHKQDYFTFWEFLKRAKETPFGKFAIINSIFNFAVCIAGGFFTIYMLKNLHLSYIWFTLITVAGSLYMLIFYPLIGRFSDRFGNIKLTKLSFMIIGLIPFLWMVSGNKWYLLIIPQLINGFGWAGLGIATNNYIYDSVHEAKRSFCVAYYNLLNGITGFVGTAIGAIIVSFNIGFMNGILFLFLISGILRIAVAIGSNGWLKEVRHVKHFTMQFIINEFNPTRGMIREYYRLNHAKGAVLHYI